MSAFNYVVEVKQRREGVGVLWALANKGHSVVKLWTMMMNPFDVLRRNGKFGQTAQNK